MFEENILYEDDSIIVIDKPPYFPVQSARVSKSDCISELKKYLKEKGDAKGEPYLGLIHRLDEPVEGIVVFAKSERAAGALSKELREGRFVKEYTAAVVPLSDEIPKEGKLSGYLLTDRKINMSRLVAPGTKGAKEACLEYRIEGEASDEAGSRLLLLKVRLYTGRHHQIRLQLCSADMPVAGDNKYGKEGSTLPLCLAATSLSFSHPVTGKKMEYSISPKFMERLVSQ